MTNNNLEDNIKTIILDTFPNMKENEFDLDKRQEEYENWDSFAHLNLITMAESKFGINLSIDDATSIISARNLLDRIKSHI